MNGWFQTRFADQNQLEGPSWGPLDDLVVKVELAPNEAFPRDMELVRYYRPLTSRARITAA